MQWIYRVISANGGGKDVWDERGNGRVGGRNPLSNITSDHKGINEIPSKPRKSDVFLVKGKELVLEAETVRCYGRKESYNVNSKT